MAERIDDGQAVQIVFVEKFKHFLVFRVRRDREQRLHFQSFHAFVRRREQQASQRDGAGEFRFPVDQKHGVEPLEVHVHFLNPGDDLVARGGFADVNEIGIHHSAGRIFLKLQQLAHLARFLAGHLAQDFARTFRRHVRDHIGCLVGIHFFENVGGFLRSQGFDDLRGQALVQLGEGFGGGLLVERGDDRLAFERGQVFHDVRQVGRMHAFEFLVRDAELYAAQEGPARSS